MIAQHRPLSNRMVGLIVCLVALLLLGDVVAAQPAAAAFPGENGKIAFVRNGRIWIKNADGTQLRLTRGNYPAWSADGTRIAYMRYRRRTGNADIWTMDADGSNRVRVTSAPAYESNPSWSPDGTKLVFQSLGRRSWDLYIVDSSPPHGTPIRLAGTLHDEQEPRWSPDGTRIAFQVYWCSTTGCGMQIGVVNADGTGYRRLTARIEGVRSIGRPIGVPIPARCCSRRIATTRSTRSIPTSTPSPR
jgi:dipeptidyl aminopeptidase/acylaminoacyl peptidase